MRRPAGVAVASRYSSREPDLVPSEPTRAAGTSVDTTTQQSPQATSSVGCDGDVYPWHLRHFQASCQDTTSAALSPFSRTKPCKVLSWARRGQLQRFMSSARSLHQQPLNATKGLRAFQDLQDEQRAVIEHHAAQLAGGGIGDGQPLIHHSGQDISRGTQRLEISLHG